MPPTRAPWRAPFLEHLSLTASPTFTLATLHPAATPPPSTSPSTTAPPPPPLLPRARTCVFRGLWASDSFLSTNTRNPAPRNPPGWYESDLPVFTTDVRSGKLTTPTTTTGGGGVVEAVFWVDHPRARTQWRVRGRAWVLAGDVDGEGEGSRMVRGVLEGRMRRLGGLEGKGEEEEGSGRETAGWSFAREVTAHFGNLSPLMRGSFRAPPPGTPLAAYHAGEGEELGQRVDDLEDEAARRDFRVVVIVPEEVDQVDLRDELHARRWLYVYRGLDGVSKLPGGEIIGEWEKVEVWP
ncbi:pyridoxamine 5'-phosphate oxidase-domain-containing protein [Chaetomium tenue]|uniref:Pyridoxamine 5'-phosphate oxidase-domain-containing protein n=1 Tax=Chaetomium tenue TaxID=1854479 RepID=A0ACB7P6J2_9PEZI|nr:pyridoxamine 5'-phosphate oxidase-domain-containing protein [Chaetomium globosum]